MKIFIYKNNEWINLETISDNVFFNALDGYNGSQKTSFFKAILEPNETNLDNFSLRFLHNYNNVVFPFETIIGTYDVQCINGDPRLAGKIKYSLKLNVDENDILSGTNIIPDENGVFRLGDLTLENEIKFSITCLTLPRIISNFGEKVEVTSIDLSFLYQENEL